MRVLSLLPLLSLACAQGQAPLNAEGQAASDPLGEQGYNKVCANPSDAEVELAPEFFVRYYCDTYPRH
ncbi:hypothetical protein AFLA70_419g001150 [Aspergillus flavus AF70]|nr:hypothetical protein AFLA70_419g001150 [Aspergillus flavus AF70]